MLTVSFVISILIQVGLPIALGFIIIRRYNVEWKVLGIGVLAFMLAQVIQSPIYQAITDTEQYRSILTAWPSTLVIILFAFLAALIENVIRFGSFWFLKQRVKAWGAGLALGAGHGGIEMLLVGFQFLLNFIFAISVSTQGTGSLEITPEEAAALNNQINAFWALPWYLPLSSALQRLSAFSLQMALSVMMWVAFSRRKWIFLAAALLWHTALNAVAGTISYAMPDAGNSLLLVGVMLVNLVIIYLLYLKAKETGPMDAPEPVVKTKGLSFLAAEREREKKPEEKAEDYKQVIEAKRAKQRQMSGGKDSNQNNE